MQEVLNMVKYVAVFYLMEQMVLNLLPGKTYERYVRFHLGLLLVLLLLRPIFHIFDLTEQLNEEHLMYDLWEEVEELR